MKTLPRLALVSLTAAALAAPLPAAAVTGFGYLDSTFSGDGRTTLNVAGDDTGEAVGIQADGKIVVAGTSSGGTDIAVVRFDADGSLDTSFGGGDGIVVTDINGDDAAYAIAIQANQKIVVGGFSDGTVEAAVVRYDTDGTPDTTFGGGDGIATQAVGQGALVSDIAIQGDGSIVAAGSMTPDGFKGNAFVARFDPSGVLDTTFHSPDGYVTTNLGAGGGSMDGVAIQGDGAIVTVGTSYSTTSGNIALLRYTSAGLLDTTFGGTDGKVTTDVGSYDVGSDVVLDADGNIVVSGGIGNKGAVLRYDDTGVLDTTFDTDGIATVKLGGSYGFTGVAVDGAGNIVAAGDASSRQVFGYGFGVARLTPTGTLDTTFGGGDGTIFTLFSTSYRKQASTSAMGIDADGRIVAAGTLSAGSGGGGDIAIARYGGATDAVIGQPDLQIGAGGTFVGDDIYNGTGHNQTLKRKVARGHSLTYSIKVGNDGNAPDTVTVHASFPRRGVDVRYFVGGNEVTRKITGFTGKPFALAPAETVTIKVVLHVKSTATLGKTYSFQTEGYSFNDVEGEDAVVAKITVGN
jgi:uncharacterized delta-60 repeat protein